MLADQANYNISEILETITTAAMEMELFIQDGNGNKNFKKYHGLMRIQMICIYNIFAANLPSISCCSFESKSLVKTSKVVMKSYVLTRSYQAIGL